MTTLNQRGSNALINMEETGPCSVSSCKNTGTRAGGARDIEPMAERTGVFVKSFYCDDCREGMAQRSIWGGDGGKRVGMALRIRGERPVAPATEIPRDER